ncbi:hypothetical protein [Alicyclobacillus fastidiosus]|uniref:DUF1795 domain-containing protein n=1 Tax=Alicyclobacillus fastidiosus TaxID=392011 RepID=A0ABV5ALG0_9BACL|nr:hypothetical protein [Alicyclobacillus fastidiosus]WEH11074.1 hypothetical protein PYS47_07610 [Alicyclobacillus fastidiosus]
MNRFVRIIIGTVILPVAIAAGIIEYPYLSYKLLPVMPYYNQHVSWPNDGIDMVLPLSVGPRIGKAPNGDPILSIPGQSNRDWVYREEFPHWWTGVGDVTSKKGIKPPSLQDLTISEIRVIAYGDPRFQKLQVLDVTKNTKVIHGFLNPMRKRELVKVPDGGKVIGIELISPELQGIALYTVVVILPGQGDYVYIASTSPNQPDSAIKMGPAFSNWLGQVQQAHEGSFGM